MNTRISSRGQSRWEPGPGQPGQETLRDSQGGVTPAVARLPMGGRGGGRLVGIDLARGLAVLGMMAAHVFGQFRSDDSPTFVYQFSSGRSAATFALVAGVSLTFIAGQWPPRWREPARAATSVGIAARAVLIGLIGLTLGVVAPEPVILPAYALLFLLAIPLLGLNRRALLAIVGGLVVVAPVLVVASYATDLPAVNSPDLGQLVHPAGLLSTLLVTGFYPVVMYLAFICAGIAIGKCDLSSSRVAGWLLGGGAAICLGAWLASGVLLFHLGGLQHLQDAAPEGLGPRAARDAILWHPDNVATPWYLMGRSPYSATPLFMLHALGAGAAVVGGSVLLVRMRRLARLLTPVAAVGSMTLTIYTAHLLILAWPPLNDHGDELSGGTGGFRHPVPLYLCMVTVSLIFAVTWRRYRRQGPLEAVVAAGSKRARSAAFRHLSRDPCASSSPGAMTSSNRA